ncbi:DUF3375 family protein [Streptomyces sp. NPDC059340]|uniref:DUF3375 family protein n=1 Tax=Streptomyces sp. NPDC059340 TaxID=3346806 RepID=UPI00369633D7
MTEEGAPLHGSTSRTRERESEVGSLDYDELVALRRHHAAWKLLQADNAALMLSFFNKVFVEQGVRSIAGVELADRLDDELFALVDFLRPQRRTPGGQSATKQKIPRREP